MCDPQVLPDAGATGEAAIDTSAGSGFDSANWGGGNVSDAGSYGNALGGVADSIGSAGVSPETGWESLGSMGSAKGIESTQGAGGQSIPDIVPVDAASAANSAPIDTGKGSGFDSANWGEKPEGSPIKDALGKLTKYGPLAAQGTNLLMNRNSGQKYADQLKGIGSTQSGAATQMVQQAQAGQINASDQASIDAWKAKSIADAKNYYAKAGLSDSSMAQQAIAGIEQQANTMHEEARVKLLQTGINALNITDQNQRAAVEAEISADKTAGTNMNNFMNTYAAWLKANPGG